MTIQQILENLNENYALVTDLVPDIYYFYDEGETEEIDDGGNDMYDGANEFYTNVSNQIPYTHTQAEDVIYTGEEEEIIPYTDPPMDGTVADGDDFFGEGSSYFTNMYPGLFVLVATDCTIDTFGIEGNIGTDGGGSVSYEESNISFGGDTYTVFFKSVGETDDPSINHIIIIPGDGEGVIHEVDTESDDDDDEISIDEGNFDTIYYLLVGSRTNEGGEGGFIGHRLTVEQAEDIAEAFLDAINGSYTFEVVTYDLKEVISGCLPDTLENILYGLNNATVLIQDGDLVRRYAKHGDRFTASGSNARYLKETFADIEKPLLKVIPEEE